MKINLKELAVFALVSALMLTSKLVMEWLPNIHLLGVFVIAVTVVYRQKALYPIYGYVFLQGLIAGFSLWWVPHLYIWTILWAVTMLLPRKMSKSLAVAVYCLVCGLHGLAYGTLYAPAQALMFGLDFNGTLAWIISGLPFDIVHGISNAVCGLLIVPIISVFAHAEKYTRN